MFPQTYPEVLAALRGEARRDLKMFLHQIKIRIGHSLARGDVITACAWRTGLGPREAGCSQAQGSGLHTEVRRSVAMACG